MNVETLSGSNLDGYLADKFRDKGQLILQLLVNRLGIDVSVYRPFYTTKYQNYLNFYYLTSCRQIEAISYDMLTGMFFHRKNISHNGICDLLGYKTVDVQKFERFVVNGTIRTQAILLSSLLPLTTSESEKIIENSLNESIAEVVEKI